MEIFPTQYSTLSSSALNTKLAESYGLADTSCRLLIRNVSDTYILETSTNKYIFKIYRDAHRKLDEIKGEIELLTILFENDTKVSRPIPDKQGEILQTFNAAEGTRYGVMFSWAEGKPVYSMSNEQLEIVGEEMASIHNITSSIQLNHHRKDYSVDTAIIHPLEVVAPAFAEQYENFDDWSNLFWGPKFLKNRVALIKKWIETAYLLLPA